jgi:penicillin-insensitive murein DD-endopeptidase
MTKTQIKAWQVFLILQDFLDSDADGIAGALTEKATKTFQRENGLREDGVIGQGTLAAAAKLGFKMPADLSSNAVDTVLPEFGTGFVGYGREKNGADQWGTAFTINAIQEIGKEWHALHPDCPLQIGDISRKGGGSFPPHASHRNGRDFDMRPIRKDSKRLPVTVTDAAYDAKRTEELVRLVRKHYPAAIIYLNDESLIRKRLTARMGGHSNHLHLRLK